MSLTKVPNTMLEVPGGGGSVVQVKSASTSAASVLTTAAGAADAIPQKTQGTELLTVTLTPTDAAHYLEVEAVVQCSGDTGSTGTIVGALFKDTTTAAFAASLISINAAQYVNQLVIRGRILAGSTSATTIKLRVGMSSSGSVRINTAYAGGQLLGGVAVTKLTVTEVLA
jgi:hypothetical protein